MDYTGQLEQLDIQAQACQDGSGFESFEGHRARAGPRGSAVRTAVLCSRYPENPAANVAQSLSLHRETLKLPALAREAISEP